jgi:hypothetical protein
MPRFFFDLTTDDHVSVDDTGQDCRDVRHANREAVRALSEIAAEKIIEAQHMRMSITVANADRLVLGKATVCFEPIADRTLLRGENDKTD